MKFVITLGVLALLKDSSKVLVNANSVQSEDFQTLSNCSYVDLKTDCLVEEGEISCQVRLKRFSLKSAKLRQFKVAKTVQKLKLKCLKIFQVEREEKVEIMETT